MTLKKTTQSFQNADMSDLKHCEFVFLGPVQTSNFLCAELNANGSKAIV